MSTEPTGVAASASRTASARSVRSTSKLPSWEGGSEDGYAVARPKQAARRRVNFMVMSVVKMIKLGKGLLRVEYD